MEDIYEEEYEKEPIKKDNNFLLIIIILLLVLIIAGILVYFLVFRDKKEDNKKNTTTTEKITMQADIKMPRDLEEYKSLLNSTENMSSEKDGIVLLDATYKDFKEPFCTQKGARTETVDGHTVKVMCTEMDEDYDDLNAAYIIDDKFSFTIKGNRTCGSDILYIGSNFIINYDPSCFVGGESMTIYNANGGESYKAGKTVPYIKTFDKAEYEDNNRIYKPFIKNNYLYFVGAQNEGNDQYKSKCNIYRLDLNNKSLSFVTSQEFECDFATMY